MADRTAAELFGRVFDLLARDPSDDHRALARTVAGWMRGYDFHPVQTGAVDAMLTLGVGREVPSGYPGEVEFEVVDPPAAACPTCGGATSVVQTTAGVVSVVTCGACRAH